MRDAVENGWPRAIEIEEHSHSAMAKPTRRAPPACRCAVFRGYRGADLPKVNPKIKSVTCPFTGEELAAVPAHPAGRDLHPRAEGRARRGDVLIEGIIGVQKEAVLAAKRVGGDGRGGGRRLRGPAPQPLRPAALDDRRRSPSCRAARIRPTPTATTPATTPPISNGTRSPPTATRSPHGCRRTCSTAGPEVFRRARRGGLRTMSDRLHRRPR